MDEIQKALNSQAADGLRSMGGDNSIVQRTMARAKNLVPGLRGGGAPAPIAEAMPAAPAPAAPSGPVAPAQPRGFSPGQSGPLGGQGPGFTYGTANPGATAGLANANPNIPAGGMSPEAAKYTSMRAGAAAAAPEAAAAAARGSRTMSALGAAGRTLGRAAPIAAIGMGGYDAVQGMREGDYGKAGLGALDAAAGVGLFTPAAPAAAVYLAGRGAYTAGKYIGENLPEPARAAIGGAVNSGVRGLGDMIGQDWGVSDEAYQASRPKPSVMQGAVPGTLPAGHPDAIKADLSNYPTQAGLRSPMGVSQAPGAAMQAPGGVPAAPAAQLTPEQAQAQQIARQRAEDQATIERRLVGMGLSVDRQRGAEDAGKFGENMRGTLARGGVSRLSDGVYSFNGKDGVRNIIGAGATGDDNGGPGRNSGVVGDPNSEYNRQVREGMIAGPDGRKAPYTGGGSNQGGIRDPFGPLDIGARRADGALTAAQARMLSDRDEQIARYRLGTEQNRINEGNNIRTNDTTMMTNQRQIAANQRQMEFDRLKFGTEQQNKMREFGLNESKFALDKDKYEFEQDKNADAATIEANKALHASVLNSLPPINGKNGLEPDAAGAAAYMAGANKALAERVKELRKAGDTRGAESLTRRGVAALGPEDKQDLTTGLAIMKRWNERNGQIFGGARGAASSDPRGFVVVGIDPQDPKKAVLRNGNKMDLNDLTNVEMSNRLGLPQPFNPRTTDYVGQSGIRSGF